MADHATLDEHAGLVFDFIRADRRVSVPLDDVTEGTGLDLAALEEALGQLLEAGLVSVWTAEHGRSCACLTPFAAEQLGKHVDRYDETRWAGVVRRKWREPGRGSRVKLATDLGPGGLPDRADPDALSPDVQLDQAEAFGAIVPSPTQKRLRDRDEPSMFEPRRTLMGPVGLPNPANMKPPGPCSTCGSVKLAWDTICLDCDALNWGLDWLLDRRRRSAAVADRIRLKAEATAARPLAHRMFKGA